MNKKAIHDFVVRKLMPASLLACAMFGVMETANAGGNLTPQDAMVTTIFEKSVIEGNLAHGTDGNLAYDAAGNARFVYSGKVYSVKTDDATGQLTKLDNQIGTIEGEAAFPKAFVSMSTGINALMLDNTWDGTMPQMPSVVPWTCNHCLMKVAGTTYVSIVDALDPNNPYYSQDMVNKFNGGLMDGAAGALDNMRMQGRAFTGLTPASFDPATKTMSVRMAGCSALVAIDGPLAGKVGTLCMNSTATFNVGQTILTGVDSYGMPTYDPTSDISAKGSSNCITVMHSPTM
jgi:hypothetical protein